MSYAIGGEANHYQPPDPGPECSWCDGQGTVDVDRVTTVDGTTQKLKEWGLAVEVPCPRCDSTGEEPKLEREI